MGVFSAIIIGRVSIIESEFAAAHIARACPGFRFRSIRTTFAVRAGEFVFGLVFVRFCPSRPGTGMLVDRIQHSEPSGCHWRSDIVQAELYAPKEGSFRFPETVQERTGQRRPSTMDVDIH